MQKRFPDVDFTCEAANDIPWNDIANKIGYLHGKYLCTFWETKVKYEDEEGKLRLKPAVKPPAKVSFLFLVAGWLIKSPQRCAKLGQVI